MVLIRAKGRPEVYLTDFLTKSWVPSPKHLDVLRFLLAAGGKDSAVKELDGDIVDGIPANPHGADWLRFGAAIVDQTVSKLPKCR